jgi:hypothetical protein
MASSARPGSLAGLGGGGQQTPNPTQYPSSGGWTPAPATGVVLYSGPNYSGEARAIGQDQSDLRGANFNDRAFSVRVAPGQAWRLCADRSYRGSCQVVTGDIADLRSIGLGGAVSSVRAETAGGGFGVPAWSQPGLTLFEFENYGGRQITLSGDVTSLVGQGFNDVARSAQVGPGESWQICQDINYAGQCAPISAASPSLGWMAAMASSARRVSGGGFGQTPTPVQPVFTPDGSAATQGRTAAFFPRPTVNGQPAAACPGGSGSDRSCVQRTAESFCRFTGYARAVYWSVAAGNQLEDLVCARQ